MPDATVCAAIGDRAYPNERVGILVELSQHPGFIQNDVLIGFGRRVAVKV